MRPEMLRSSIAPDSARKWYDHMMPDKRWATEKEKRVWNKVRAKPTNALKPKTTTRRNEP